MNLPPLKFKESKKGSARGRWYMKIDGENHYFSPTGDRSDAKQEQAARKKYQVFMARRAVARQQRERLLRYLGE